MPPEPTSLTISYGPRRVPAASVTGFALSVDPLRQRRNAAHEARVHGELPAVVFLVGNPVVHPGEARPLLPVEAVDELQHVELPRRADPLFAVGVGLPQRREELPFRSHSRDPARVLDQQAFVRLAPEVSVGTRELSGHQETRLDDVLEELDDRAALLRRAEPEVLFGKVSRLLQDAAARVGPGLQGFFEHAAKVHAFSQPPYGVAWE